MHNSGKRQITLVAIGVLLLFFLLLGLSLSSRGWLNISAPDKLPDNKEVLVQLSSDDGANSQTITLADGVRPEGQLRVRYSLFHHKRDAMPGMIRVSFGLYNTLSEVVQLVEALQAIARGDYGEYTLDQSTGIYTPAGVHEDYSAYFKI